MPALVSFELANGKEVDRLLSAIVDRIKKPKTVYEWVADNVLMPALAGQFKTEGARGGLPWQRYTPQERQSGYVGYKKSKTGQEGPLLDWKGRGRRLVPSFTNKAHPEHIHQVSNRGVVVGSKTPWAIKNHKGQGLGWQGKYTIPKRPIAVLTTRIDIAAIVEAFEEYVALGQIKRGPVR